jgi:proteasome beta subunit
MADQKLSTGTTTMGIVCKDGILLAADRRVTAGHRIFSEGTQKVIPIDDSMVLTIAGSVQLAETVVKLIRAEAKLFRLRMGRRYTAKEVANLIGQILSRNTTDWESIAQFVFAAKNEDGSFELYNVFIDGTVWRIKKYAVSGSGSTYAEGLLETTFKPEMTIAETIPIAKRALTTAITKDSASGNGADIFKLTKNGVEKVETIILTSVIS